MQITGIPQGVQGKGAVGLRAASCYMEKEKGILAPHPETQKDLRIA